MGQGEDGNRGGTRIPPRHTRYEAYTPLRFVVVLEEGSGGLGEYGAEKKDAHQTVSNIRLNLHKQKGHIVRKNNNNDRRDVINDKGIKKSDEIEENLCNDENVDECIKPFLLNKLLNDM